MMKLCAPSRISWGEIFMHPFKAVIFAVITTLMLPLSANAQDTDGQFYTDTITYDVITTIENTADDVAAPFTDHTPLLGEETGVFVSDDEQYCNSLAYAAAKTELDEFIKAVALKLRKEAQELNNKIQNSPITDAEKKEKQFRGLIQFGVMKKTEYEALRTAIQKAIGLDRGQIQGIPPYNQQYIKQLFDQLFELLELQEKLLKTCNDTEAANLV
jgi:hypothetical protein